MINYMNRSSNSGSLEVNSKKGWMEYGRGWGKPSAQHRDRRKQWSCSHVEMSPLVMVVAMVAAID